MGVVSLGLSAGAVTGAEPLRSGATGEGSNGAFGRPLVAGGAPNISHRSSSPALEFSGTAARGDDVLEDPIRGGGASIGTSLGSGLDLSIASSASNSVKPRPPSSKLFSVVSGTESAKNSRSDAERETDSDTARRVRSDSSGLDLENLLKNRDTLDVVGSAGAGWADAGWG